MLQWAAARGKADTVAALEEWGAGENETKALLAAAQKGSVARVEALLKRRVSPQLADENGHTALMVACREGHHDVMQVLGCDPQHVSRAVSDLVDGVM